MSVFNNILLGASSQGGTTPVHTINQSIRFNDDDSPILKKTYSSAGTEETFTFSCWVKRGNIGSGLGGTGNYGLTLFSGGPDVSNYGEIVFRSSGVGVQDSLDFYNSASGSVNFQLATTQLFRDTSAWYHIVCVMDTTNVVESERMRIYVNGSRVTDFSTETYPSKDAVPSFNTASEHGIGGFAVSTDTRFFDGYLAEIVFLDGTATDCNSFAEFNSSGIWIPKDVSGLTFGTNGFHIDGRNASALGQDEAGSNDFAATGLDIYDQVADSPTNNFCVMNPNDADGLSTNELSGGNLQISNINRIRSTLPFPTSGKWYWEVCTVSKTQGNWNYGMLYFKDQAEPLLTNVDFIRLNWYHGSNFSSSSNWTDGDFWTDANNASPLDVFGFAWDSDTKKVYMARNNVYYGSADPANGTGTAWGSGGTAGVEYGIAFYSVLSQVMTINYGQDDSFNGAKTSGSAGAADDNSNGKFYYAPPTGFLALCTKNLGAE